MFQKYIVGQQKKFFNHQRKPYLQIFSHHTHFNIYIEFFPLFQLTYLLK